MPANLPTVSRRLAENPIATWDEVVKAIAQADV
jgi:hypothetical protein